MSIRMCALAVLTVVGGCLEDQVDEARPSTFSCASQLDCEEGLHCVLGLCELVEGPSLEIRHPEAFDRIDVPAGAVGSIAVAVYIGGHNLELTEPSAGELDITGIGYVDVLVDGELATRLTSGSLAAGVAAEVPVDTTPGAHRITAIARTPSGARYDNAEAIGMRLVWIDDGSPRVAFVRPWPDTVVPATEARLEIELATINFDFVALDAQNEPTYQGNVGHAHLHYDAELPECIDDPNCDCCYLIAIGSESSPQGGTTARAISSMLTLPPTDDRESTLSAILRTTSHAPFHNAAGALVHDSVTLERRDMEELDDG